MCKLLLNFASTTINYVFLTLWSLSIDFFTIQGTAGSLSVLHSEQIHPLNIRKRKPYKTFKIFNKKS